MRAQKGFSLVELMIVVAIIGILAAIAIPNFVAMQLKSKRSEMPGNVDGIKTAELSYDAAFDGYVNCATAPRTIGDKQAAVWITNTGYTSIGWAPDGNVRAIYSVATTASTDFQVNANSDVDADGAPANYSATTSINATLDPVDTNVY